MKNVMLLLVLAMTATGCAAVEKEKTTDQQSVVAEDNSIILHCQAGVCRDERTGEIYDYSGGIPKDGYYRLQ